uniref:Uncharacterized protein n=1 Tax=Anguilla anguilla TaxID=7936 RepID=A0A0E9UU99_ANGAN
MISINKINNQYMDQNGQ